MYIYLIIFMYQVANWSVEEVPAWIYVTVSVFQLSTGCTGNAEHCLQRLICCQIKADGFQGCNQHNVSTYRSHAVSHVYVARFSLETDMSNTTP